MEERARARGPFSIVQTWEPKTTSGTDASNQNGRRSCGKLRPLPLLLCLRRGADFTVALGAALGAALAAALAAAALAAAALAAAALAAAFAATSLPATLRP